MTLKEWLKWNRPMFMTRRKLFGILARYGTDQSKIDDKITWCAIRPVISSLKELRNNTWDKDRVDHAIKFLTDNFEPEPESEPLNNEDQK